MSKESSVAPKERINIKYVPATGDAQAEIELPLKMLVVGDFTGKSDEAALEDRKAVSIDKNNFTAVMRESDLSISTTVPNRLTDEKESELALSLQINSLADFSPDALVSQVPELHQLMALREALVALKGPLGNIPAFRNRLQELVNDQASREKLLAELNMLNLTDEKD